MCVYVIGRHCRLHPHLVLVARRRKKLKAQNAKTLWIPRRSRSRSRANFEGYLLFFFGRETDGLGIGVLTNERIVSGVARPSNS